MTSALFVVSEVFLTTESTAPTEPIRTEAGRDCAKADSALDRCSDQSTNQGVLEAVVVVGHRGLLTTPEQCSRIDPAPLQVIVHRSTDALAPVESPPFVRTVRTSREPHTDSVHFADTAGPGADQRSG